MRRPLGLASAGLVLLGALTACGGEDVPPPALDGGGPTGSAPTASTSPTGDGSGDPRSGGAEVGPPPRKGQKVRDSYSVTAGSLPDDPAERAVAQAFVDFLDVRVHSLHDATVMPRVSQVATGDALAGIQGGVATLRQDGKHTDGAMRVNVSTVEISGRTATLSGCIQNATSDVDAHDVAVESPAAAYLYTATAVRFGARAWLISAMPAQPTGSC